MNLDEERYERVIMEIVEFHLITEGLSRCVGKHMRPEHLVNDINRVMIENFSFDFALGIRQLE